MRKTAALIPVLALSLLTGCGGARTTVTLRNLTGYEIASAELAQESDSSEHKDRLEGKPLADGENREITLGKFTEEELAEGFSALICLSEGSEEDFGHLILRNGDVLTIYIDDISISAGVNLSDGEVAALIQQVHDSLHTDSAE